MARAIASRLLHEPTLRLKRSSGEDDAYLYVNALRELFGLDAPTAPPRGARRRGAPAARGAAQAPGQLSAGDRLKLATRGSRLALAQARLVAEALGGAEIVEVRSSDGEPGDKERFVRGVEQAVLDGEADLAVHSAKDLPGERPDELRLVGRARPRRSRRRLRGRGVVARRAARGCPHRHRQPAPPLPAPGAAAGPGAGRAARQRRHPPAEAVGGRVRRDRARRRRPAPSGPRGRDRLQLRARGADAGRRPGIAGAGGAPRGLDRGAAGGRGSRITTRWSS